jgi:hypothetical protein
MLPCQKKKVYIQKNKVKCDFLVQKEKSLKGFYFLEMYSRGGHLGRQRPREEDEENELVGRVLSGDLGRGQFSGAGSLQWS